ncbi:MAG: dihydrodipicolinate synthase family protein, partial [Acidimicrobiia bacterium]|nr:dihydrodipicolinate synthase family protein [Acidimicrobiia bacterium]
SSGSIDRLHMLARDFPHIGLACGMDDQALEFFAWGARAWVCAGSNFLPREHIALYEACVVKSDFEAGRRIMSAMLPLMRVLEQGGKFVQSVKYGCELTGLPAGPPRPPLRPLTKDDRRAMREVVATVRTTISTIVSGSSR